MTAQPEQRGSRAGSRKVADGNAFHHECLSVKSYWETILMTPMNWNLVWRMRKCWLTGEYIQQRNRRGGRQSRSLSVCRMCIFTFTQLCEDQELGLSGVRLLLTDGSSGAELNHVGVTRQLFLYSEQVKEHAAKTLSGSIFQPHWND